MQEKCDILIILLPILFYRMLNKDLQVDVNEECLSPYTVDQYVNPLHCGETLCLFKGWQTF